MRSKLQKFTEFADTLLPHEVAYLLQVEQFQDDGRLQILKRIAHNIEQGNAFLPYDETLDKRKYSNLKNWITERLEAIDVDKQLEEMLAMERAIMTDSISAEAEKKLLKMVRTYTQPDFYFQKFYELLQHYRHFLIIRMRYADHKLVNDFLQENRRMYERSTRTSERMHEVTLDVVQQYSAADTESKKWEKWLTKTFYDETLDGQNRYLALIRLIFIAFNYRNFEQLRKPFEHLDAFFLEGKYYSKRLLLNYYGNRLLLHTKFGELDKAIYYGYLSIRGKNNEYVHYINNLSAVLQRQTKHEEALQLMRPAFAEMKTTQNYHDKIGFVSFYANALNRLEQFAQAEQYCESFLNVYKALIFKHRWHLFFSVYLESLLQQRKYAKLHRLVQKNDLLEKDETYQKKASYLPTISWYGYAAALQEAGFSKHEFKEMILAAATAAEGDKRKLGELERLLKTIQPHISEVVPLVRPKLFDIGIRI